MKRRFILTKLRFTATNRRFIFSRKTIAKTHLKKPTKYYREFSLSISFTRHSYHSLEKRLIKGSFKSL